MPQFDEQVTADSLQRVFQEGNERDYQQWLVERVLQSLQLTPDSRLAVIGCGNGEFAACLAKQAHLQHVVWAADASNDMVTLARKYPCLQVQHADVIPFAQANLHYDRCLLKEVIHLLPPEELKPLYRGIYQQLHAGGVVLTVTRPQEVDYPFFAEALARWQKLQPPWQRFVELQKELGFEVKSSELIYPVHLAKAEWVAMLRHRYWSNLVGFSEEELEAGIVEVEQRFARQSVLSFEDRLIFLQGQKSSVIGIPVDIVVEKTMKMDVVEQLDELQRDWLAEVLIGMILVDGKVDDAEFPYLQKALGWGKDEKRSNALLAMARMERKARIRNVVMEGKIAFEVMKLLAGVMIVDGKLVSSEVIFFYEVGQKLGLPDKPLETLWKTARKEMEDQCPKAIARLGEEARVVFLQQISLERVTFRYHRPVVKGAHGSLNLQRVPDADLSSEKDWYSSLHGQVLSTHQHAKDPRSFLLRFEFTQSLRDDHGLLQLLGIPGIEGGK